MAEPRLLRDGTLVPAALEVHDAATSLIERAGNAPANSELRVLRQALGYGWSIVVAADPALAWPRFQRWSASPNEEVRWIVAENLKKDRLRRLNLG